MAYADFVNRFSTTKVGRWVGSRVAARIDPHVYRLTNGRFTSTGRPTLPMFALTTTGRKSGAPRTVQLAYATDGDDWLVVASNFGQDHHPGWRYNLEAQPHASIQLGADHIPVRSAVLSDEEKARLWPSIEAIIPQMAIYKTITDRNIRVFRLTRR